MGPQHIESSRLRERERRQERVRQRRAEEAKAAPDPVPFDVHARAALRQERAAQMPEVREQRLAAQRGKPRSAAARIADLEAQVSRLQAAGKK